LFTFLAFLFLLSPANAQFLNIWLGSENLLINLGTVENFGSISIASNNIPSYNYAIHNEGTFDNYEEIDIKNSYGGGLYNEGDFFNRGGTFKIGSTSTISGMGIRVEDGIVRNQNYLGFPGLLEIDQTIHDGIEIGTAGSFQQLSGTTNIGINVTVDKYGIDNDGDFVGNGGTINIVRSTWSGIKNRTNGVFTNNTTFINIGAQNTGSHGINNNGVITNNKTINIKKADDNGILNTSSGSITNNSGSTISIGTSNAVGQHGINNSGSFTNKGNLTIKSATLDGIYNLSATFQSTNGGLINIGTSGGSIGERGIYNNNSTFTNNASTISIGNTGDYGLFNLSNAIFNHENASILNIGQNGESITQFGLGNSSSSTFTNSNSTISIDNAGTEGLYCQSSATFVNNNSGIIDIGQNQGNIGEAGLLMDNATFENNGGTIRIDNTGNEGLTFSNNATFENKGGAFLFVGENGSIGEINEGAISAPTGSSTLLNSNCSEIYLYDFISLNLSSFTNSGLLFINTDETHSNSGTFTNNGVINYVQDNPIPNVTNNDLIISPLSSTDCFFTNVVEKGAANNFNSLVRLNTILMRMAMAAHLK